MKSVAIMLRLVLAAALILPISIFCADAIAQMLMPFYRAMFELLGGDYRILFFGLTGHGVNSVIRVDVSLAHTIVAGGHVMWADPRGMAHVSTLAVQAMQPAATALIAVLGWPCLSLSRGFYRLSSLAFFLLLITLLDVPFLFAGEVWGTLLDQTSPVTGSPLLYWSQFLQGGGRLALGIFAALASLAVEDSFAKYACAPDRTERTRRAS